MLAGSEGPAAIGTTFAGASTWPSSGGLLPPAPAPPGGGFEGKPRPAPGRIATLTDGRLGGTGWIGRTIGLAVWTGRSGDTIATGRWLLPTDTGGFGVGFGWTCALLPIGFGRNPGLDQPLTCCGRVPGLLWDRVGGLLVDAIPGFEGAAAVGLAGVLACGFPLAAWGRVGRAPPAEVATGLSRFVAQPLDFDGVIGRYEGPRAFKPCEP